MHSMQQGTRCKWMWNQALFQFYGVRKAHSFDIWSYLISMINNKKRCSRLSPHPPGINKYIKKEEWYVEIEEDLQMSSIKVNKHGVICKWDLTHWQGRNIQSCSMEQCSLRLTFLFRWTWICSKPMGNFKTNFSRKEAHSGSLRRQVLLKFTIGR